REPGESSQLIAQVDAALAALPEELRVPLTLHFLCGRSQAEVAQSLGVNQSTVSRRIDKGLNELRRWLKSNGVTTSLALLPGFFTDAARVTSPPNLAGSLTKIGLSGVRRAPLNFWRRPLLLIAAAARM